jgi:hypothetical protein
MTQDPPAACDVAVPLIDAPTERQRTDDSTSSVAEAYLQDTSNIAAVGEKRPMGSPKSSPKVPEEDVASMRTYVQAVQDLLQQDLELERKARDAALKEVWATVAAQQADLKVLHESSYIAMNQILKMSEKISAMSALIEKTEAEARASMRPEKPDGYKKADKADAKQEGSSSVRAGSDGSLEFPSKDAAIPTGLQDALKTLAVKLDTINNLEYGMVCRDMNTVSANGGVNAVSGASTVTVAPPGSAKVPRGKETNGNIYGAGSLTMPGPGRPKEQLFASGCDQYGLKTSPSQQGAFLVDSNATTAVNSWSQPMRRHEAADVQVQPQIGHSATIANNRLLQGVRSSERLHAGESVSSWLRSGSPGREPSPPLAPLSVVQGGNPGSMKVPRPTMQQATLVPQAALPPPSASTSAAAAMGSRSPSSDRRAVSVSQAVTLPVGSYAQQSRQAVTRIAQSPHAESLYRGSRAIWS